MYYINIFYKMYILLHSDGYYLVYYDSRINSLRVYKSCLLSWYESLEEKNVELVEHILCECVSTFIIVPEAMAPLVSQQVTMVQTRLPFCKPLSQAAVHRRAQNST